MMINRDAADRLIHSIVGAVPRLARGVDVIASPWAIGALALVAGMSAACSALRAAICGTAKSI